MNFGEMGYLVSTIIFYIFTFACAFYSAYSIYYAYIKTKDEREKFIVLRGTANAFTITLIWLFVYYITQISVNYANVAELTRLWDLLHFGPTEIHAGSVVSIMMALLGICLFRNKRKAGGD